MLLKIGHKPDHGFDEPLGLLQDCHRRIEHFLLTLVTIAGDASGRELGASQRAQFERAIEYFATAAPRHTADEEDSLFPRLRHTAEPATQQLMERLAHDHAAADEHHHAVDRLGKRWLADGVLDEADYRQLSEHLRQLKATYDEHIAAEDRELFPAAARVLPAKDIEAIGREMAARRQNTQPGLS